MAAAAAADGAQQQRAASPPSTAASSKGGAGVLGEVEAIALRQRRARFREHCNQWAAALGQCAVRVWHLQRVLAKQVDAVTNERFLDVLLRSGPSSSLLLLLSLLLLSLLLLLLLLLLSSSSSSSSRVS